MRPFRFGISLRDYETRSEFVTAVQTAEANGFATVCFADHLGMMSPMVAATVAADVTERIRVTTMTLNNDFRHPAVLAQEAATLDVLSEGRLELGLGAGHAQGEYEAAGLAFDPGSARVDRLAESAGILKSLFAGDRVTFDGKHYRITDHVLAPLPTQGASLPLLIGGNGPRLLTVAAQTADIVQFTGFTRRGDDLDLSAMGGRGFADRFATFSEAAGDRLNKIELSTLVQRVVITDDRKAAAAELVDDGFPSEEVALNSPFLLLGTVDQIVEQLRGLREHYGISYFVVFDGRSDGVERVVAELAGT